MQTWRRGAADVQAERVKMEVPLTQFMADVHERGLRRIPGVAVFPHPGADSTPIALRQLAQAADGVHEGIVIVNIVNRNVPHVRHVERASVRRVGHPGDGVWHIDYSVGFNDSQDVPRALLWAQSKAIDVDRDPESVLYFLSSLRVQGRDVPRLGAWRKALFLWLLHSAANRTLVFHLPPERTVVLGGQLTL